MNNHVFYIAGNTDALRYAARFLEAKGQKASWSPSEEVTDLLLPVPSFQPDGMISGGGDLAAVLETLPKAITVMGGNLNDPLLQGYRTFDLLRNEDYLAQNAAITAECALRIAVRELPFTLAGSQVLILGWGRIGKCLARILYATGAEVTVAARKDADRAIAAALGYSAISYGSLSDHLGNYRIIFNTVPFMVLNSAEVINCRPDCIKIDLASAPGIGGSNVIRARGLPGKMMPETSGHLIAQTVLEYCLNKEDSV